MFYVYTYCNCFNESTIDTHAKLVRALSSMSRITKGGYFTSEKHICYKINKSISRLRKKAFSHQNWHQIF